MTTFRTVTRIQRETHPRVCVEGGRVPNFSYPSPPAWPSPGPGSPLAPPSRTHDLKCRPRPPGAATLCKASDDTPKRVALHRLYREAPSASGRVGAGWGRGVLRCWHVRITTQELLGGWDARTQGALCNDCQNPPKLPSRVCS